MPDRVLRIYQGEDQTPVTDITDMVEWPDSEFGQRAHLGEGTTSRVRFRDEDGRTGNSQNLPAGLTSLSLAAHNVVTWVEGSNTMFRGRMSPKDYSRGAQVAGRAREVDITLDDYNKDLHNIVVHDWVRGSETDRARVQGLMASYLSGNPRVTTNLNGSNYVSSSNTVTLPANTYNRSTTFDVLNEIAAAANKLFFVTIDGEMFYDGHDSTAYASPLRITTDPSLVDNNLTWEAQWDMGPASTEDGQQLLSGVWYFYSESQYVHITDPSVANQYSWWEEVVYDNEVTTAAAATTKANALLARRKYEQRTYNVSIGPLTRAQIGSLKHGMLIQIKAMPITDADDQFVSRRITELRWTTPEPERWFAHMTLDRPQGTAFGSGPRGETIAQPAPVCTPATAGTAIHTWNWTTDIFDIETGLYGALQRQTAPYYAPADGALNAPYGRNKNGQTPSDDVPITAGTNYTFTADVMWEFDPAIRDVDIEWRAHPVLNTIRTDRWITGSGHATATEYQEGITLTAPVGANRVRFVFPTLKGIYFDNLVISTAGTAATNNEFCLPDPGDSPFFARSDDPRFDSVADSPEALRVTLTNKSGASRSAGDVVVVDTTTDNSFTTTTTASFTGHVGIVAETIANNADGEVIIAGMVRGVNLGGAAPTRGHYLYTATTAGRATTAATRDVGAFGQVTVDDANALDGAILWGQPQTFETSQITSFSLSGDTGAVSLRSRTNNQASKLLIQPKGIPTTGDTALHIYDGRTSEGDVFERGLYIGVDHGTPKIIIASADSNATAAYLPIEIMMEDGVTQLVAIRINTNRSVEFQKHLLLYEIAAPGTPAAGIAALYVKADGKIYLKDDAGTEYDLTETGALTTTELDGSPSISTDTLKFPNGVVTNLGSGDAYVSAEAHAHIVGEQVIGTGTVFYLNNIAEDNTVEAIVAGSHVFTFTHSTDTVTFTGSQTDPWFNYIAESA